MLSQPRWTRTAATVGALSIALAGCGGRVYLHSDPFATEATAMRTSLPADLIKPYDDALQRSQDFAAAETLGIARMEVAQRNAELAALVDLDTGRVRTLKTLACSRFDKLMDGGVRNEAYRNANNCGGGPTLDVNAIRQSFANWSSALQRDQGAVSHEQKAFLAEHSKTDPKAVQCEVVLKLSEDEARRAGLLVLLSLCGGLADTEQKLKALGLGSGELFSAFQASNLAQTKTKADLSPVSAQLQQQIDAAKKAADKGDVAQLGEFRQSVAETLKELDAASREVGWTRVQIELDKLMVSTACNAPKGAISDDVLKAANCPSPPSPTAGAPAGSSMAASSSSPPPPSAPPASDEKAAAGWQVMQAVAELGDANNEQARSARWIAAAKAIVQAEQDSAKLDADLDKAKAETEKLRFFAALGEADNLDVTGRVLAACRTTKIAPRKSKKTPKSLTSTEDDDNACWSRGLAAYQASWDQGRAQQVLLERKLIQLDRRFYVRRQRLLAQRQQALIVAGADTLKAAGDGGVDAKTIAAFLVAIGLLTVK